MTYFSTNVLPISFPLHHLLLLSLPDSASWKPFCSEKNNIDAQTHAAPIKIQSKQTEAATFIKPRLDSFKTHKKILTSLP